MMKSERSKAEQKFAAAQKKDDKFLKQKEKAWQEQLDKTARLKALRLAKEAADREAAGATEADEAEKADTKKKKS